LESDQEVNKTTDVVLVVGKRTLDGLGNRLECGEVNDTGDARPGSGIHGEQLTHLGAPVVHLVETESRHDETMLSAVLLGEDLDGVEDLLEAVAQVVNDNDVVAILEKLKSSVRSNIAESTEDHDIMLAIVGWENVVRKALVEGIVEQLRVTRAGRCRALKGERCR
jgi:predicted GTPase